MIKKFGLLFNILLLTLVYSTQVQAYQYWGGTAKYKLTSAPNGKYSNFAIDNYSYNGNTYNFKSLYYNALRDWNDNTDLDFTSGSLNQGVNMWVGDYGNNDWFGWAEFYNSDGSYAMPAVGKGPTEDYDYADSFLNVYQIDAFNLTNLEIKAVATHELGHAFGLAHEHNEVSVMDDEDYLSNNWYYVQTDDINGINNLY